MKNAIRFASCAIGGVLIGFFANRLDTIPGALLFTLGVLLIVFVPIFFRNKKQN